MQCREKGMIVTCMYIYTHKRELNLYNNTWIHNIVQLCNHEKAHCSTVYVVMYVYTVLTVRICYNTTTLSSDIILHVQIDYVYFWCYA